MANLSAGKRTHLSWMRPLFSIRDSAIATDACPSPSRCDCDKSPHFLSSSHHWTLLLRFLVVNRCRRKYRISTPQHSMLIVVIYCRRKRIDAHGTARHHTRFASRIRRSQTPFYVRKHFFFSFLPSPNNNKRFAAKRIQREKKKNEDSRFEAVN